jgi:hypothetical protein
LLNQLQNTFTNVKLVSANLSSHPLTQVLALTDLSRLLFITFETIGLVPQMLMAAVVVVVAVDVAAVVDVVALIDLHFRVSSRLKGSIYVSDVLLVSL